MSIAPAFTTLKGSFVRTGEWATARGFLMVREGDNE